MRRKREQLRSAKATPGRVARSDLLTSLPAALPRFVPPMQCKIVDRLPVGEEWRYELKLDGYRAEAVKTAAGVRLISRNQKDLTGDYPELVEAVQALGMREGVLDGEIVAVDASGRPSFQTLQHLGHFGREHRPVFYFAFDLLNLESKSPLALPLVERKELLARTFRDAPSRVRFASFLEGDPNAIAAEICRQNLEGIVAKRANSRYEPDKRSGAWMKWKCGFEQEFVIGGYTRGSGGRTAFGALIVGYHEAGKLRYAAKVGTGFSVAQIRQIIEATKALVQAAPPFEHVPIGKGTSWSYGLTAAEVKTSIWLKPVLVCRVRFTEWTRDGHLRHPTFEGIRADKSPTEVIREQQSGA